MVNLHNSSLEAPTFELLVSGYSTDLGSSLGHGAGHLGESEHAVDDVTLHKLVRSACIAHQLCAGDIA